MDLYRCTVCGYLYEPANGDATRGIPGGTRFEELPRGWVCPVCGAPREMFAPVGAGGPEIVQGFFL
ncbi:MAG: rubredoxin [Deltaproteobacteria bacterium]|nr:rubredoxin [Deltaproteobacteria bacterium]